MNSQQSLSILSCFHLAKFIPVHSLILSSHLFYYLPLFLFPFTVPRRIVFAKPEDLKHGQTILVGWLVVLSLTALWDNISVYIGPSPKEREKEEKGQMRVKMSKPPPPAPTASAIGPCPTVINVVGRPGTRSLPSTIAPPDHPPNQLSFVSWPGSGVRRFLQWLLGSFCEPPHW